MSAPSIILPRGVVYVDYEDSVAAAVAKCYDNGGGEVVFGGGSDVEYDIDELVIPFDTNYRPITLRGQGFGMKYSPTRLKVPHDGIGLVLSHTAGNVAGTVRIENLEINGGAIGIHIPDAGVGWWENNLIDSVMLRNQSWVCYHSEAQVFASKLHRVFAWPAYIVSPDMPPETPWPDTTIGFLFRNHQNQNMYDHVGATNCGLAGVIFDLNADGSGGVSTLKDSIFQGNWGASIAALSTNRPEERALVEQTLGSRIGAIYPATSKPMSFATQLNGMAFDYNYDEGNGWRTGSASVEIFGHLHDAALRANRFGPGSQAQRSSPNGPLMWHVHGYARRVAIDVMTGGSGMRAAGQSVLAANHSSTARMTFHDEVRPVGFDVSRTDYPKRYHRLWIDDNGDVATQDVHEQVVGSTG